MEVINGSKCTQAIVTQPEIWIPCFCSQVKCKQEAFMVNTLRQALKDSGDQQYMSIFNWADLLNSIEQ